MERGVGLSDIVSTGIMIDAKISSSLLQNIFFPNSPLHDGAVIIQKERVVSAGCILPLSDSVNLSKELGTRHRAALGMVEHADALVIIVSEETGAISMAMNGKLSRFLDGDTLMSIIKSTFNEPTEKKVSPFVKLWRSKNDKTT